MACGFSSLAKLGYHSQVGSVSGDNALGFNHVSSRAHEGDGQQIDVMLESEFQVLNIFFG